MQLSSELIAITFTKTHNYHNKLFEKIMLKTLGPEFLVLVLVLVIKFSLISKRYEIQGNIRRQYMYLFFYIKHNRN